ncbi:MAG: hypothetical protein ACI9K2_007028, partial [Myxococcota bacterium]
PSATELAGSDALVGLSGEHPPPRQAITMVAMAVVFMHYIARVVRSVLPDRRHDPVIIQC